MHAIRVNLRKLFKNVETLVETLLQKKKVRKSLEWEMSVVFRFGEMSEDPFGIEETPGSLMLPCLLKGRLKINW
ncbi:MAG: hypothetical protein AMS22_11085 [Thiotrichales bacterium SG8_50]|nr:MAG: hypothetical protein AMS22_11085 [Thiotrichales bacterium SG8_50]